MRPRILQAPRHLGHSSPRSSPSSALRPFTTTPTLSTRIPALLVNPKPLNPTPKYVRPRRLPRATALGYSELQVRCTAIPPVSKRPSLINEESARDLVRAWGIDKLNAKEGQGGVTVIDCYAGPGGITRALLELPNVTKVIALEEAFRYIPMLEEAKSREADPDRLTIVQQDAYSWETYTNLDAMGLFKNVETHPWEELNESLFITCQLPNTRHGEQLFYQFQSASATAGKMWLYRYGRFSSGYLGPKMFLERLGAKVGTTAHHKLAVLVSALVDVEHTLHMDPLTPPEAHFHKPSRDPSFQIPVKVTPRVKRAVQDFDSLAFITKNLFIAKQFPWEKAVGNLSPGAVNLVPKMRALGMPPGNVTVNELTVEQWSIIADVYHAWPFRPPNYMDTDWSEEEHRR